MRRNSLALCALLLAGCDKMTVGNRTERSGDVRVAVADNLMGNASVAPEAEGAPMAWRVSNGAAFYGAANQPAAFALRCDRGSGQIIFERAGSGTALNLSTGGAGISLGTRSVGQGRVQARTGMGDAVLDSMARPQAQIAVSGGAETLTMPGGVAIRRVVDFCRTPPEAAVAAAPENAAVPANAVVSVAAPTPDSGGEPH